LTYHFQDDFALRTFIAVFRLLLGLLGLLFLLRLLREAVEGEEVTKNDAADDRSAKGTECKEREKDSIV
jgi:hypothetical protein